MASHDGPRSVVVNRDVERVAQGGSQFDPFDEDVAMPEPEAPAAEPQFDPFEADDAASAVEDQAAVEELTETSTAVEEAFEEPQIEEEVPTAADELEAAQEAIDRELMRREVESGAEEELVVPEAGMAEEEDALEAETEMQDEIVPPAQEEFEEQLDEAMSDEELDLDLQYGEDLPQPELTPEQIELRRQQLEEERRRHLEECEVLYDEVRRDSIKNISLDIRLQGVAGEDYPFECEGRNPQFQPRNWSQTVYLWKASGLCHKPLYFEQVQLERYGHSWGPALQPIMSGAHFFGTIPILPYKMGLETPQECIYELGNYRPGSCAPYMITQPGFTWRAAAFEAAAVTGVSAAVP
ncbi:MAG TPA: hypothetical protein VF175_00590 [Lacipirellula sp.]